MDIKKERRKEMITVTKSTYVPKEDAEMKILSVSMNLDGNIRRCEAMLDFVADPIARQGLMMLRQDLLNDRAKLKNALKEIEKRSAQN
jgi:hypothetical protein